MDRVHFLTLYAFKNFKIDKWKRNLFASLKKIKSRKPNKNATAVTWMSLNYFQKKGFMETYELLIFSCVLLVTLGPPVVDDLALQSGHLSLYGGQYGVS